MKKSIIVALMVIGSLVTIVNANGGPEADFTWTPTSPSTATNVNFIDQSTHESDIIEWVWNFGDGGGSTLQNPTHKYTTPGDYTVTLVVVWNISGNITADIAEKVITIANQDPVANAGPDQVVTTKKVTLNGSASYDPDGEIVSYEWDFDDGTTGTGITVQHTYAADGIYTVTLTVTDDFGAEDEDTAQIIVDTTSPQTTADINGTLGAHGWYLTNVTVTLTVNETVSGINTTYYRIDGGNWTLYQTPFVISDEGTHLLEYYSDDEAGNTEQVHNVTIKIDKTSPTATLVTPEEKRLYIFGRNIFPALRKTLILGKITVEATATDNIGITNVKVYINGEEVANLTDAPYEWAWGQSIGNKNLSITAFDDAGWNATDYVNVFIVSIFKPRETIELDPEGASDR